VEVGVITRPGWRTTASRHPAWKRVRDLKPPEDDMQIRCATNETVAIVVPFRLAEPAEEQEQIAGPDALGREMPLSSVALSEQWTPACAATAECCFAKIGVDMGQIAAGELAASQVLYKLTEPGVTRPEVAVCNRASCLKRHRQRDERAIGQDGARPSAGTTIEALPTEHESHAVPSVKMANAALTGRSEQRELRSGAAACWASFSTIRDRAL
jgi:hypothetical protein